MLKNIRKLLPLSNKWQELETFSDVVKVSSHQIHACGISTSDSAGTLVAASAAALDKMPWDRAYYELIERTSTIEALSSGCFSSLFPASKDTKLYKYSSSNGVAAGSSFATASASAFLELVERDRILRSWFGGAAPVECTKYTGTIEELSEYESKAYSFEDRYDADSVFVIGVFLFPKKSFPLVFGFGAALDKLEAFRKAEREALQRVAFLFDQEADKNCEFTPDPLYHQEFFLRPENRHLIEDWLSGRFCGVCKLRESRQKYSDQIFTDITPSHLKGKTWVVKGYTKARIPLIFGKGYDEFFDGIPRDLAIHPIA